MSVTTFPAVPSWISTVTEATSMKESKLSQRRLSLYTPEWPGNVENWAKAFAYRNTWRVTPVMDFDDLYNELYMKFLYCCRLYPTVVDEKHFIVLFQRAALNLLNTLSKKRGKERAAIKKEMDVDALVDAESGEADQYDELAALMWRMDLAAAPEEVRELVNKLSDVDPSTLYTRRNRYYRETTEGMLRRILGNPSPTVDLAPTTLALLGGA